MEPDTKEDWPAELLELRDKLTSNAKKEMQLLRETHTADVQRLKDDHSRTVARMIDRHQEELNKMKSEGVQSYSERNSLSDPKILEERYPSFNGRPKSGFFLSFNC